MKKKIIFIVLLLIIGFYFRLYLANLAFPYIYFDMKFYHALAVLILHGSPITDCCIKNPGYSIFLAAIYFLFGENNLIALRISQVILDLIVSLLIYGIAYNIFSPKVALFSFVLYILNPFTSSYTGLRLAEIYTLFSLACAGFIASLASFKTNKIIWFVHGMFLGLILLIRVQFYYFTLGSIILIGIFCFQQMNRIRYVVLALIGFILINSYSLIFNYYDFHKISLVTPYHYTYVPLYLSYFQNFRYPELLLDAYKIDPDVAPDFYYINLEANITSIPDKAQLEQKYKLLFLEKLNTNYMVFTNNVLHNIIWLWDKNHLFSISDPFYPEDSIPVSILNILLLAGFFGGLITFIRRHRFKSLKNPVFLMTIFLFFYITFMISLVSNESRHSMIFYPLILLWAGYGYYTIWQNFYKKRLTTNLLSHHRIA